MSAALDPGRIGPRAYRRRARRARSRMTLDQRAAFDMILVEGLTFAQAAARLSLDEREVLRRFVSAFRIHVAEIEAPRAPWWRLW